MILNWTQTAAMLRKLSKYYKPHQAVEYNFWYGKYLVDMYKLFTT